jgi:hypothetical protein
MVSPSTPAASTALVTAFLISAPIAPSDSHTSAVSCQVSTAFAAASAAPSLASVDEIHVLRAASMMSR